jgi:hypothetical protein
MAQLFRGRLGLCEPLCTAVQHAGCSSHLVSRPAPVTASGARSRGDGTRLRGGEEGGVPVVVLPCLAALAAPLAAVSLLPPRVETHKTRRRAACMVPLPLPLQGVRELALLPCPAVLRRRAVPVHAPCALVRRCAWLSTCLALPCPLPGARSPDVRSPPASDALSTLTSFCSLSHPLLLARAPLPAVASLLPRTAHTRTAPPPLSCSDGRALPLSQHAA